MRRRGVTLIEAVLYVSIALALIVGGLVFFQQASLAQKTSDAVRMMSSLASEARIVMASSNQWSSTTNALGQADMTPYLISSGAVPGQYVQSTSTVKSGITLNGFLVNPWGGQVWVGATATRGVFLMNIFDVPVAACARLIASNVSPSSTNANRVVESLNFGQMYRAEVVPAASLGGTVNPSGRNFSPSQAANACRYGTTAYGNQTGDYSGAAPALSTVNIILYLGV